MITYGTPSRATTPCMVSSARPPLTSLTMLAPACTAASATCARMVSMLTVIPAPDNSRITGNTRAHSSSGVIRWAPGRVDSPPTSITSAPCACITRACSTARSTESNSPPSEKESGVTFSTPHTTGACTPQREQGRATTSLPHDQRHRLRAGGRIVQVAAHRAGDGSRTGLAHPAYRHAHVLGFDHHDGTAGFEDAHQRISHLRGKSLLDLRAAGEYVHQRSEFRESGDLPGLTGQIPHVGDPVERQQVVLAGAVELDVLHEDEFVVADVEGGGQDVVSCLS